MDGCPEVKQPTISNKIGNYIKGKGYNLSEIARKTGLNYKNLYASLYDSRSNRDLRAQELITLCIFLDVDPRMFAEKQGTQE